MRAGGARRGTPRGGRRNDMRDDERQPPATDGHEGAAERRAAPARP
ncbi:recombination regulator RecX, partial [Streptomyces sp. SID8380]|nr:recombination regulator RecX [Streptomyces sp. SID8380]